MIDQELQDLHEAVLAMTDISNADMPDARTVSHGTALTVMRRSLARTGEMPMSVRSHLAFRDLSDFISMSQKSKSNLTRPLNTDLLPIGNPMSTAPSAMTAAAFRYAEARWIASDPRITDDEARTVLVASLAAAPFSDERMYYSTRLSALPTGTIPLEALVAGLGDGNSTAARRARAQKQLRDSEGKWIWMGGGLRALVRRANGAVNSFSGRAIAAGDGINDMSVDMELGDGRIARIPAAASKSSKAYLENQQTPDGFATTPAKYSASDPVINESDIQYVDSPHGFDKDPNYAGPGTRYSDGYYSVTKFDVGDPNTPENTGTDPSRPTFAVARVNDDGSDESPLGYADNWSGAQDGIRADQPKRDGEEGRPEDPVARLDGPPTAEEPQAAPARRGRPRQQPVATPEDAPVGDLPEDMPADEMPTEDIEPIDIPEDATPQADINPNADADSQMTYDVPADAYTIDPNKNYIPQGRRNEEAEDYTDDPAALAQIYNTGELTNALAEALSPQEDGPAAGKGELSFDGGDEMVPAEALSKALQLAGGDPHAEIARIYDGINGNSSNSDRLATLRGGEVPVAEIPEETQGLQITDLPEAMQGMSDAEFQKFLEDGDYTPFLLENQDLDMPEGYSYLDLDPGVPATDEDRAAAGLPDAVDTNPVNIAMQYDKDDLLEQLRAAVEPNTDNPGYGQLLFDDGSEDGYAATVPAEILRDALQLQGVDTNGFLQQIADDGFAGQQDLPEDEAGKILAELDGTPGDMAPAGPEIDRYELSQLAADMGIGRDVRDAILDGADIEDIKLRLDFDPEYQEAKQDYDTRMDVDLPRAAQRAEWSLFERFQKALNPQPTPETPVAEIPEPDPELDPMPEGPPDNPRQWFSPNKHWMWMERNAFIPGDTDRWVLTPRGQEVKDRLGSEAAPETALTPEEKAVLDDIIKDIPGLDIKVAEDAITYDEWADMPERTNEPDNMPDVADIAPETDKKKPVLDAAQASLEKALTDAGIEIPVAEEGAEPDQMAQVLLMMQNMQAEIERLRNEVVELRANQKVVPEETQRSLDSLREALGVNTPAVRSLGAAEQEELEALNNRGLLRPAYLPANAFAIETVDQNGIRYVIYAFPRDGGRLGYDVAVWNTDTGESAIYGGGYIKRPTEMEDLVKEIRDNAMWAEDPDYNLDNLNWEPPADPESPLNEMIPSYLQLPPDALGVYHHIKSGHDGNYYAVYAVPNGDGTYAIMLRREDDGSVALLRNVNSQQEALDNTQMIADDLIYENIEPGFYFFTSPESTDESSEEEPLATWERELLEPAPEGMFVPVRQIVGADGKKYEVEIHVDGEGRYVVSVRDEDGVSVNVGAFDDVAAANIQQNHMAQLVEQNADLNIQRMIREANRNRGEAEEGVNPHMMPERRGEGGEGRIRGRGRRAANGANNDTPMIPILDKMRDRVRAIRNNDAMQRARSQMKKYFSGWDTRGNNHPRPTHEIQSREVRPEHFDAKYTDMNGNVIRNGDIVVHNRAGEMVNPDWEAVNLIKGRVVDRGSIWRNGKRHDGYLTVEVIDSDNDDWNGRFFTYKSNMVEIIEQPDLKDAVEAEIARRGPTPKEMLNKSMWNADDKELHQMWGIMQTLPDNDPLKIALEREMYKRWLVPPRGMADYLNWVSDEGLAAIPNDIAMQEGFNGLVLRRLVANERARRAAGGRPTDPMGPLPESLFLDPAPGEAIEFHPNLRPENPNPPVNPNPGGRAPMPQPIARPRRMRPARPRPDAVPQEAEPVPARPARGRAMANALFRGLDPRTIFDRFVGQKPSQMIPQGSVTVPGNTPGVDDKNFGTVNPDTDLPNASQADYSALGWDDKRAAEIAEAARSRVGVANLAEMIRELRAIQTPNADPNEVLDQKDKIENAIKNIFGVGDDKLFGSEELYISDSRLRINFELWGDKMQLSISGDSITDADGNNRGRIEREVTIDLANPSQSYAYNAYFLAQDKNGVIGSGGGVSDAYNRYMENWYIANNIGEVKVHAAGGGRFIGAARWALNNFDWQNRGEADAILRQISRRVTALQQDNPDAHAKAAHDLAILKARIAAHDANPNGVEMPSPIHFVMVGWRPGVFKNWVGWETMASADWHGTKKLVPKVTTQRERIGYTDFYQKSRDRMQQQQNVFVGSDEFRTQFGTDELYATPAGKILAPFRDEFSEYFGGYPTSLAALSPPARHALTLWNSRGLSEPNIPTPEVTDRVALAYQLREELKAYDTTAKGLGPKESLLVQLSAEDIRNAANGGGTLKVGGVEDTGFKVRKLQRGVDGGVMDTFMLTDQASGQVFFAKLDTTDTTHEEVNDNLLARALGMRGAAYVQMNNGEDIMFTTFAGNGIRNATDLRRAQDAGINWDQEARHEHKFDLTEIVSFAILDAITANTDRHIQNWLVAKLDNHGVEDPSNPEANSWVPLAIDHGHAWLGRMARRNSPLVAVSALRRADPREIGAIGMFGTRMRKLSLETRAAAIRAAAQSAYDRLESLRPASTSDAVYDRMQRELLEIINAPTDTWRF